MKVGTVLYIGPLRALTAALAQGQLPAGEPAPVPCATCQGALRQAPALPICGPACTRLVGWFNKLSASQLAALGQPAAAIPSLQAAA